MIHNLLSVFKDKAKNFYDSIQDGAEETAKKIEKVLTLMKIDDATNKGNHFRV